MTTAFSVKRRKELSVGSGDEVVAVGRGKGGRGGGGGGGAVKGAGVSRPRDKLRFQLSHECWLRSGRFIQ